MGILKRTVPGDTTILTGMKTVMADFSEKDKVHYIPDISYVKRGEKELQLQLLLPCGMLPGAETKRRFPLVVFVQGAAWQEQDMYHNIPQLVSLAKKAM